MTTASNLCETVKSKFLQLSGGTMKGAIGFEGIGYLQCKNSTSNGIQIYGGNAFAEGAFLGVYGKDHASRAGWIYANANNGVNSSVLIGKPDGTLTWGGKEVERVGSSGVSWIRYENGLQICWGSVNFPANTLSAETTLPVAFADTKWRLSLLLASEQAGTDWTGSNRTTTKFTTRRSTAGSAMSYFDYIAIGLWK